MKNWIESNNKSVANSNKTLYFGSPQRRTFVKGKAFCSKNLIVFSKLSKKSLLCNIMICGVKDEISCVVSITFLTTILNKSIDLWWLKWTSFGGSLANDFNP